MAECVLTSSDSTPKDLSSNDLKVVYKKVFEARAKWRCIGIELNLTPGTLDAIEQMKSDPADRLERVLTEWINKGGATWKELVEALFSVPVGETKLARQLDQSHCSGGVCVTEVGGGRKSERGDDDTIQQLNSDIRTMERRFRQLQRATRESLKERDVPCVKLLDNLMAYSCFRSVTTSGSTLQHSDLQPSLSIAKSIDEIFRIVAPFWSFLDYELLEDIINDKSLGSDSDRLNLEEYITSLKEFLNSWEVEPYEICCHKSELPGPQVKFHFKLDTDSLSVYWDVKAAIAQILEVEVYDMQLYSIEDGCIELVFLCHHEMFKLPLSREKSEAFFAMRPRVLKVRANESVLFERQSMTEPEATTSQTMDEPQENIASAHASSKPLKRQSEAESETATSQTIDESQENVASWWSRVRRFFRRQSEAVPQTATPQTIEEPSSWSSRIRRFFRPRSSSLLSVQVQRSRVQRSRRSDLDVSRSSSLSVQRSWSVSSSDYSVLQVQRSSRSYLDVSRLSSQRLSSSSSVQRSRSVSSSDYSDPLVLSSSSSPPVLPPLPEEPKFYTEPPAVHTSTDPVVSEDVGTPEHSQKSDVSEDPNTETSKTK